MTHEGARKALLDELARPKEIRTNDGRLFLVEGVEPRALGGPRLTIPEGAGPHTPAIRSIASIGAPTVRRRRRA